MLRIILAISALFALAACETAEGFGRDVQKAGEVIEEEADG